MDTKLKIYLASPYSHPDKDVREARFKAVCKKAGELIREGYLVYCPIAHSHPITENSIVASTDFSYWKKLDFAFLDMCEEVWVLQLDGWDKSVGVHGEMIHALNHNKIVRMLDPDCPRVEVFCNDTVSTMYTVDDWPEEFFDVNQVLQMGANKYGRDNWLQVDGKKSSWEDMHNSMFHHLAESYGQGIDGVSEVGYDNDGEMLYERVDNESRLDPLLHLMCRAMMTYTRLKRGLYK